MELPKNEKTISIDVVGETSQQRWQGDFIIIPIATIAMTHELALQQSRLNGDLKFPSSRLSSISEILATCAVHVKEAPEWWDTNFSGINMLDKNVMVKVYDEIIAAGKEWREQVKKEAEASPKKSSKDEKDE